MRAVPNSCGLPVGFVRFRRIEIQQDARGIPTDQRPNHQSRTEHHQSQLAGNAGERVRLSKRRVGLPAFTQLPKARLRLDRDNEREAARLQLLIDVLQVPKEFGSTIFRHHITRSLPPRQR